MPFLSSAWRRTRAAVSHRRTRRGAIWLIGLTALYALLGFVALPYFAKPRIEQALADAVMRPVRIEHLYTNPFSLSTRVEGLRVLSPDGQEAIAGVDEVYANIAITSLFRLAPVADRIRIVGPHLNIVRHEDGQYNFQDVIDRYVWQAEPPKEDAEPFHYSLNNIELIGGRIEFDDRQEKQQHEVRDLRIGIPFLSTLPYQTDIVVRPELSAVINGAPLAVHGETIPFGENRASTLYINLDGFELPQYLNYVPIPLRFTMVSGALDARLVLRFAAREGELSTLALHGTAGLRNLELRQRDDEPLVALDTLALDLRTLDLLARRLEIASLDLSAPRVQLTRFRGGNLNLELLMPLASGPPNSADNNKPSPEAAPPFTYLVDALEIKDGRVDVLDYAAPQTFKTALTGISLRAKQIGGQGEYDAALRVADQGRLTAQGTLSLEPVQSEGKFAVEGLGLQRFQPYIGSDREIAGGTLSGGGKYRVALGGKKQEIRLNAINATLRNTRINTAVGKDRWRAGTIAVRNATIDVAQRRIGIEAVEGSDVAANVLHEANGDWHVTGLLTVAAQAAAAEAAEAQAPAAPEAPWDYEVKLVSVANGSLRYEDRAVATPVKVQATGIDLKLSGLSSADDAQPELALNATVDKGRLSLAGPMTLAPFSLNWKVTARSLPLMPFEPYWADQLNLDVTRGALSSTGRLRIGANKRDQTAIRYGGDIVVSDFAARDARQSRDLLRWKELRLRKSFFRSEPLLLRVGAISLDDFYSRLVIRSDGSLNLQKVVDKPDAAADTAEAAPPPTADPSQPAAARPRIEIGDINLSNGQLSFADFYIKPNYSAEIEALKGTIGAMSPEHPGRVELTGQLNDTAPVNIDGQINPLGESLFLDIQASAREVNLPPLSPYSVRYIGYPIERGKLSMDVHYHIENDALTAQNELILNQLVFGEKVESEGALNVPVHLAVSLLKDSQGVINLNVPISGSLNDPQFSIGGVIARVIGNLFIKAVTSPFAAIGAILGGGNGERLSYIEFAPGSAELDEADTERLALLARALRDRPALSLDIAGRVNPDKEAYALRYATLMRRLQAEKRKDAAEESGAVPAVDQIEIAPEEYEQYLKRVYDAADFDKPRNFLGFAKRLPREEMERLLMQNIEVSENAKRRLADQRAQAAMRWLREEGQIPAERLFLIAPRLGPEGIDDDGATTRVDFALRH